MQIVEDTAGFDSVGHTSLSNSVLLAKENH